jgi:hypothetical protein
LDFWFKNIPSGNPVGNSASDTKNELILNFFNVVVSAEKNSFSHLN